MQGSLLKKLLSALIILSLLFVTACGGGSKSSSGTAQPGGSAGAGGGSGGADGKTITIGISETIASFYPLDLWNQARGSILSMMLQPLAAYDETFQYHNVLADSIETDDYVTYTVKLKPAKWTDGTPVTVDDFIFTLHLYANPKTQKYTASYLNVLEGVDPVTGLLPEGVTEISGVKKIDDLTMQLTMRKPTQPDKFYYGIGSAVRALPKHILGDVDPAVIHQHEFMQTVPVSNGPYKLAEFQRDQYIKFVKNPDYVRGEPKIDTIYIKTISTANIVPQLIRGEIDMNFPYMGDIAIQDYEKVKNLSNVNAIVGLPINHHALLINNNVLNHKMRQALAAAIDRQMMVENLLQGYGKVIEGVFAETHPFYINYPHYKYDPERAKQLVEEAGWDKNKVLRFHISSDSKTIEQAANLIAEYLKVIGVKTEIHIHDYTGLIRQLREKEFDLAILSREFPIDPDISVLVHSQGPSNFMSHSNPRVDELLEKGISEFDPVKRKEIYKEMQEELYASIATITLYGFNALMAVNKRVTNGGPKEVGMMINVHEWDVAD